MKNGKNHYIMFVDESGNSHLNHSGEYFILSTIIINSDDFEIIQGYLRLLKRNFLGADLVNIHMTDLCERPYRCYRKLLKPKKKINSFFMQLSSIVHTVPFWSGMYSVDKNKLRSKYNYTPGPKKIIPNNINMDLPYEITCMEAFKQYAHFLEDKKATGEIVVESRYLSDGKLVGYFDNARTLRLPGNIINNDATFVKKNINSITISNKKVVDSGLELADIASYCTYRALYGDPMKSLKVDKCELIGMFRNFCSKSYIKSKNHKMVTVKKCF